MNNSCGQHVQNWWHKLVGVVPQSVHNFAYSEANQPLTPLLSPFSYFYTLTHTPTSKHPKFVNKTGVVAKVFHLSTPFIITIIIYI